MKENRIGIWIIGAKGSISLAMILGTMAINRGLKTSAGMVTETELCSQLSLPDLKNIVFGGCDIRTTSLFESAKTFCREFDCFGPQVFEQIGDDLDQVNENIVAGTAINCGRSIEDLAVPACRDSREIMAEIDLIRLNLREFKQNNQLSGVVVVNLASTEPPLEYDESCHNDIESLIKCFERGDRRVLRASTMYAYCAISEGFPYINFTPSNAALPPAMISFAEAEGVPVMGNDGKTGETLVKSTLAPMFLSRNLEILSWEGFNILGNLDGKVLSDPDNCASKLKTKDQVLHKILGYSPHSKVHINYVPSLADQKTAWDFIHFKGFMDAKMSLQFTWQGYDSLLAAPIVLDMVRLAAYANQRGERGLMHHLASFFKAPLGVEEYSHDSQFEMLVKYLKS